MSIGEHIKLIRERKGLSINQLALYSSVSAAHISRIERGLREPTPHVLKKISKALKIPYEELMETAGYLDSQESTYKYSLNLSYEQLAENVAEKSLPYPEHPKKSTLTKQDREEIKRDAEYIKNAMMSVTGLAFNGKPQDEETLEKVMAALEEAMILARKEAQRKYTPKKYRKKEE